MTHPGVDGSAKDLGAPSLDDATTARLVDGLATDTHESIDALVATRDTRLAAVVASTHDTR